MISFEELRSEVENGAIDTVAVAFTDMEGRLMSKRLHGEFFVDQAAEHFIEEEEGATNRLRGALGVFVSMVAIGT